MTVKEIIIAASVVSALSLASCVVSAMTTVPLIPYHVQRERRRAEGLLIDPTVRRRRTEADQVGALYHGYGTHYMDLWVGTPPQRQTVIVDTGSGLTAFPCSSCKDCGAPKYHIDNYFEEDQSSTFSQTECGQCKRGSCSGTAGECKISMSYQEGSSWYAFEAKDTCYVGGPHNVALITDKAEGQDIDPQHASHFGFPMTFGCQTRLTGLFKTQLADGIMGMENAKTSFWKQMYDQGKMEKQQFSLCFSRPVQASKRGTEAGAMTLGGVDKRLHDSDMVWTENTKGRSGFFSVHVRAVYLRHGGGGPSAKATDPAATVVNLNLDEKSLNQGGVIVDSGTTDTYWNRKISSAFRDVYKQLSGGNTYSHSALSLTEEQLGALPTILFQLAGDEELNKAINADANQVVGLAGDLDKDHPYDIILAIPPSHYMELDNSGKYTARFYDTEGSGSVFGGNAMMGHDVLFDADHNRIGWAESHCDYTKLVTEAGYVDVLAEDSSAVEETKQEEKAVKQQEEIKEKLDETEEAEEKEEEQQGTEEEKEEDDTEKKKEPSAGTDAHDSQSPADDVNKAFNGLVKACNSNMCRGGVFGALFVIVILVLGCCFGRCCCASKVPKHYQKAEVELAKGNFSSYMDDEGFKDEPNDDAEYGEFGNKGKGFS